MTAATLTGPRPRRRNRLGLVIHQVRYEQLSFWRNPQSAMFTFVFPVVFVALMGALFGGVGKSAYFGGLSALQYYVPTIAALCVLGSCYGQLAVALAARRQNGILNGSVPRRSRPGRTSPGCSRTAPWSAWPTSR